METIIKRRRPRFSRKELQLLINGVEKRKKIVEGKFPTRVSTNDKRKAWEEICSEVNSVSCLVRTPGEVRKKWVDYKSVTKRKGNFQAHEEAQIQNNGAVTSRENVGNSTEEKEFPIISTEETEFSVTIKKEVNEELFDMEVSISPSQMKDVNDYFQVEDEQLSKQETKDSAETSFEINQNILIAIKELINIQKRQLEISERNAENFQKLVDHLTQS
ncbi:myb-related transcription factor, partner of profilin-like [Centruroides vittatus]|uniref:myb-related transcription factor, partner of profilin-like n=1 Tax=Centruroides vittatus TaxID=120091 RepID=UPI0035109377